jgi:hypothetical protein
MLDMNFFGLAPGPARLWIRYLISPLQSRATCPNAWAGLLRVQLSKLLARCWRERSITLSRHRRAVQVSVSRL